MSFIAADEKYRSAVESVGTDLQDALNAATQVPIDLHSDDITVAALLRLKSFFIGQDHIKAALQKVYAAPAADFLVETIAFYLKVVLSRLTPDLTVAVEKTIQPTRNALRPDITVWRGGTVVAAVECKTQLGWNRDGWLTDFELREAKLLSTFPNARMFLFVMTASNWAGFGDDPRTGHQFFVMLQDIWPRYFDPVTREHVVHRVEQLIQAILSL